MINMMCGVTHAVWCTMLLMNDVPCTLHDARMRRYVRTQTKMRATWPSTFGSET